MQTKVCNICKVEKSISDYHPNKTCTLGVVGTCKPCYKIRITQWYADNRQSRQEAANKRNRDRKALMVNHFGSKCHDCSGEFHQCVYEFHHLDPSQKDVNPSKALTWSLDRMWKELDKCIMLCSNCHKVRHFGGTQ